MDTGDTLDSVRVRQGSDEPFGLTLRRLRDRAGLTQEQLAGRAGISANAVSSLERGVRRHPYPHTRDALARALQISPAERAEWDEHTARYGLRPSLPSSPTAILGRSHDIAEVIGLLESQRVVTLTGPGGVGKTRLALAVAEQLNTQFPDGVLFVALAALQQPTDVLPAIATALGLRELGPRDVPDVLVAHLRTRQLLLVLDNVEHLLAAAPDVAELISAAHRISVLATSRAPLRIRSEHIHAVAVLPRAVAADLFAERVAQATGQPLLAEPSVVAALCAGLDHLPLAIELAAAQTRLLTPAQVLHRLTTGPIRTASGPRDLPQRQQTMRDTVRWSYELLAPTAQALLRQVAVFSGGWTMTAAMTLGQVNETDALDQHLALLDLSLIIRDASGTEPRFAILETVRVFALEQLAATGALEQARDDHAALFCGHAAAAGPDLWSEHQSAALDDLEADHDNLRSALRHALNRARIDELAAACFGSWLFWVIRGHLRDPLSWVDAALAANPDLTPVTRARLQYVAGVTLLPRGRYDEAAARFEETARLAGDAGDDLTLCWTLVAWAHAEVYRGRAEYAAALLDAALHAARRADAKHAVSCAVIGRAHVAIAAGSMSAADDLLTRELPVIETRGAAWPLAVALGIQGRIASVVGDHARADRLLTRSTEIFGELEDTWGMAHQLTHVADVAAQRADHTRAALLYGVVDALADEVGARVFHIWQELSDRCQSSTLTALGIDRFTELRRRGRTLTHAAIIELAIGGPVDHPDEVADPPI